MASTTKRYLSHPDVATGITRASSGSTAWSFSAYTELVPVNHITTDFYIAGLTWMWHTPIAAADTTYEWIIEIATGAGGAEVLAVQIPASVRGDTLVGYVPSNMIILPEPKYIPANTRLSIRVAYNTATTSNTLSGIKLLYQQD